MYKIDRDANRLTPLRQPRFADLEMTERYHLQEWILKQPDVFGEPLLMIAKEFAGFNDTRERLDLLAIDRQGRLVLIENKLDDSGRDVVWQALKYTAYCSTLKKSQIADIFQEFLGNGEDAKRQICEFLEKADFEEVSLNPGNSQRIILVAAEFRKEVTSTVLWLLTHKMPVKCFKVTPYQDGDDRLFLSVDQLIPLPEAEELMISIAEKEEEEEAQQRSSSRSEQLYSEFWPKALEALRAAGVTLYANNTGTTQWFLNRQLKGVIFSMVLLKNEARMHLGFSGSQAENRALFDFLHARRSHLEERFGAPLTWDRGEESRKSSAVIYAKDFDGHNRDQWLVICDWFVDTVARFERTFSPEISALQQLALQVRADANRAT